MMRDLAGVGGSSKTRARDRGCGDGWWRQVGETGGGDG